MEPFQRETNLPVIPRKPDNQIRIGSEQTVQKNENQRGNAEQYSAVHVKKLRNALGNGLGFCRRKRSIMPGTERRPV